MLSQWWIIWVGNTFPQGDAGLLRLLAARNDLGPAPSSFLNRAFPWLRFCLDTYHAAFRDFIRKGARWLRKGIP